MALGEAEAPEEAAPPGAAGSAGGSVRVEPALLPALLEEDARGLGRESEELRPVSLTDLFAADPECAAKGKAERQAGGAGLARSMQFAGARLDDELELKKLQVFVRIRPSVTAGAPAPRTASAADAARENCVHATSRHSIAIAPPEGSQAYKSGDRGQTYSFSRVFDRDTPQEEYYEATAAPLVRDMLRNPSHNSVMLAYGITAAGKTYTIEGTKEAPGVLPRALVALFEGLACHVEPVVARAAYYEVYNEQIYDLLDEQGVGPLAQRAALRLKEDAMGRVFVAGLSEVEVGSADEALAVLRRGSRQRQRAETGLNYNSSRSHSIFTVTLYQQGLEEQPSDEGTGDVEDAGGGSSGEEKLGRMSFVDLAGSERAQRTGNVGVRLKESVAINSSLMTLGRCLEALRWNQQHKGGGNLRVVPYRESKVTHLFRDALHGWGQVILSVNVSPVSKDYDETAHVLKYAALATQIGTIQQAEAPRRTIKAVSPAIRKVKRKAALPPEARRQGGAGGKAKKAKKERAAKPPPDAAREQMADEAVGTEAAEVPEAEGSLDLQEGNAGALCEAAADQLAEGEEDQVHGAGRAGGSGAARGRRRLGLDNSTDAEPADGLDEADMDDEEGQEEYAGTPTTPTGAEEDEAVAMLQAQVQQLISDLQKAEERCVLLEAEVREEVADEMAQLLRDMEESYRLRLEAEVEALERKMVAGGSTEEAAGKRGRARGGKAASAKPELPAADQQLAAARAEAGSATAQAEQLRQEVDSLLARLAEAQAEAAQQAAGAAERIAELEAQVEEVQRQAADAADRLASEQQRAAGLEAELTATREQAQAELATVREQAQAQAELATVREQAQAQAELATVREQAQAELEAVREHAQAELEAVREHAQAELATMQQQGQAKLAAVREQAQAELVAVQQQCADLQGQVAAAQQQAGQHEAELAEARQQVAQLAAELAAQQQQQAVQLEAELASAQLHAAHLEAELAAARQQADSTQQQASEEYEAQLQEAVTQLEANKSMELEMAEQQCERLRKENQALMARLQAALGALAACGSPLAGPGSLAARMAQAAPEGNGRGAGGTPHDVALARARQAAAADEAAAAAAAAAGGPGGTAAATAGGSAMPRSRSRFAEEAKAACAAVCAALDEQAPALPTGEALQTAAAPAAELQAAAVHGDGAVGLETVPEVVVDGGEEAQEQLRPAPRCRGRRKKAAPALTSVAEEEGEEVRPSVQPVQQQQQAAPQAEAVVPAPPAESKRSRRMTRSAAVAAAPMPEPAPAVQPPAVEPPAVQQPAVEPPAVEHAQPQPAAKQRRGQRRTLAPPAAEAEPVTGMSIMLPLLAPRVSATDQAAPAPRRRGRASTAAATASDKENAARQAPAAGGKLAAIAEDGSGEELGVGATAVAVPQQEEQPAAKGGKRRKRLLPSAPAMSLDMRAALGELEDGDVLLPRRAAAKKAAAAGLAAAAVAADGAEAGPRRSRRQTQFYRL